MQFSVCAQDITGYVEIPKGKLFYQVYGEGEPVVFLNGGPGFSSHGYELYAEEISKYRKVILFDQRGTGKSELKWVNSVSIQRMVSDMEALREHLDIDTWDVVGHSFGGVYAMHYLSEHPDRINSLVLSASPGYENGLDQFQVFKDVEYESIAYLVELEEFEHLKKEMLKGYPSEDIIQKVRKIARAKYYVSKEENYLVAADWFANKCQHSLGTGRLVWKSVKKNPLKKELLQQFEKPVLILHGSSDFINISNPIMNNNVFPNSRLEIIYESGHIMSMDQPESYFQLIREFLEHKGEGVKH